MNKLWTEKYRPTTIDGYVFKDDKQREQVKSWLQSGSLPNLLFTGAAGTGKTTMAKMLLHSLDVDWGDVLVINASMNNGVDYIRDTISGFVSTMPFGEFKYVLLDEADYISPNGQAALRNLMESYSNTARFILTGNYPNKIIPALHSRCQGFHIEKLDVTEFTARMATILIEEEVSFDIETLDMYVAASYPDMRKCINLCQQHAQTGTLHQPDAGSSSSNSDYQLEAIALFRSKKYKDARELIASQIQTEEYEDFYRFMYRNLDLWADDESKEMQAILAIRNGLVKHVSCADSELNLSATLVELEIIARS